MGWGTRRFVRLEISKRNSRTMHDLISKPDISRTATSSKRKIYACNSIIGGNPANRFSIAVCWDFQARRDLDELLKPYCPINSTMANDIVVYSVSKIEMQISKGRPQHHSPHA
jgi:hypothetical protein